MTPSVLTSTPCPECGAPLERHTGTIEEPVMSKWRDNRPVPPRRRLGTYLLCTACEHGEEI